MNESNLSYGQKPLGLYRHRGYLGLHVARSVPLRDKHADDLSVSWSMSQVLAGFHLEYTLGHGKHGPLVDCLGGPDLAHDWGGVVVVSTR